MFPLYGINLPAPFTMRYSYFPDEAIAPPLDAAPPCPAFHEDAPARTRARGPRGGYRVCDRRPRGLAD